MNRISYLTWITYALIIAGYIVAMSFPQGAVPGYSCVVGGLFSLIILIIVPLTHVPQLSFGLFAPLFPMLVVLGISAWLLAINVKYSKYIQENNLTREYKTFNVINFILLLVQLVVMGNNKLEYKSLIISFIASFQLIVVLILQMNLQYFITDG